MKGTGCMFHPEEHITNFCRGECLLPLCPKCLRGHVEEHDRLALFPDIEALDTCLAEAGQALQLVQRTALRLQEDCQALRADKQRLCDSLRARFYEARQRMINDFERHMDLLERNLLSTAAHFDQLVQEDLQALDSQVQAILRQALSALD
jgi:hypothetical protein